MGKTIALPARSRAVLERMIEQRERVNASIEALVEGIKTALDVPEGYTLRALDEGFVPPPAPEPQTVEGD